MTETRETDAELIARVRELASKATPGPWAVVGQEDIDAEMWLVRAGRQPIADVVPLHGRYPEPNAELVASSREAMPELATLR